MVVVIINANGNHPGAIFAAEEILRSETDFKIHTLIPTWAEMNSAGSRDVVLSQYNHDEDFLLFVDGGSTDANDVNEFKAALPQFKHLILIGEAGIREPELIVQAIETELHPIVVDEVLAN